MQIRDWINQIKMNATNRLILYLVGNNCENLEDR